MKVKRSELQALMNTILSGSNLHDESAKRFNYVLVVNKRMVKAKIDAAFDYHKKTYKRITEKAVKADKALNFQDAEALVNNFRNYTIPALVDKYSKHGDGEQYLVNGAPRVHISNMEVYQKEADELYEASTKEAEDKFPKEIAVLEEISGLVDKYYEQEVSFSFMEIKSEDVPPVFSANDIDKFGFMIGGLDGSAEK